MRHDLWSTPVWRIEGAPQVLVDELYQGAYRFKEFGDLGDADNTFVFCEFEDGSMALLGASRTSSYGHDTFTEII